MKKILMLLLSVISIGLGSGSNSNDIKDHKILEKLNNENRAYLKNIFKEIKPRVNNPKLGNFTLTDIYENYINFSSTETGINIEGLNNKIVLLNFITIDRFNILPSLIKLQDKYRDKLMVITIDVGTDRDFRDFVKLMQKKGINHIAISSKNSEITSFFRYIVERADWRGTVPFMIALDVNSDVQYVETGARPYDTYEELIRKLDLIPSHNNIKDVVNATMNYSK
jgi:hypothetical protein